MNTPNENLALKVSTKIEQCFWDQNGRITVELIGDDNPMYDLKTFTSIEVLRSELALFVGLFGGNIEGMTMWSWIKVLDQKLDELAAFDLNSEDEVALAH